MTFSYIWIFLAVSIAFVGGYATANYLQPYPREIVQKPGERYPLIDKEIRRRLPELDSVDIRSPQFLSALSSVRYSVGLTPIKTYNTCNLGYILDETEAALKDRSPEPPVPESGPFYPDPG